MYNENKTEPRMNTWGTPHVVLRLKYTDQWTEKHLDTTVTVHTQQTDDKQW